LLPWLPSKKGVAIAVEKLPLLMAALSEVMSASGRRAECETSGELLDEDERKLLSSAFDFPVDDLDAEIVGS
jgi:hypothetical protein